MKKTITCPVEGCLAELTYEAGPESAELLGATACSLTDGEVDCEQKCIKLLNIRLAFEIAHAPQSGDEDSES
jgi:hypothetical protein